MGHPTGCAGGAGYLGDSHCMGEGTFPAPVSCIPTKLRADLVSTALQTLSPGSASRHTRLGRTDPCLVWKGDGGLPPTGHRRHCPDTRRRRWSGSKRLPWLPASRPRLTPSSIPRHPCEPAAQAGWHPSLNTRVPKATRLLEALFPPNQTQPPGHQHFLLSARPHDAASPGGRRWGAELPRTPNADKPNAAMPNTNRRAGIASAAKMAQMYLFCKTCMCLTSVVTPATYFPADF